MGEHEKTDVTEADRLASAGAETGAKPGRDDVGPVSGGDDDADSSADSGADDGPLSTQPGADPADAEEIEEDRQERLDPDNRPEDAEVDNTDREFDAAKGMYTDSEGYEQAEERFPPMGEQGA
jgi:hypothetical protein